MKDVMAIVKVNVYVTPVKKIIMRILIVLFFIALFSFSQRNTLCLYDVYQNPNENLILQQTFQYGDSMTQDKLKELFINWSRNKIIDYTTTSIPNTITLQYTSLFFYFHEHVLWVKLVAKFNSNHSITLSFYDFGEAFPFNNSTPKIKHFFNKNKQINYTNFNCILNRKLNLVNAIYCYLDNIYLTIDHINYYIINHHD